MAAVFAQEEPGKKRFGRRAGEMMRQTTRILEIWVCFFGGRTPNFRRGHPRFSPANRLGCCHLSEGGHHPTYLPFFIAHRGVSIAPVVQEVSLELYLCLSPGFESQVGRTFDFIRKNNIKKRLNCWEHLAAWVGTIRRESMRGKAKIINGMSK